jgi:hypothetical protein
MKKMVNLRMVCLIVTMVHSLEVVTLMKDSMSGSEIAEETFTVVAIQV